MEFKRLIKERASIRKYSSKKPKIEQIIEIIQNANLAPSPGNLPIARFIIIENKETIEKIAQACQQNFISQAPFVIVVCSDSKNIKKMYDKRAKTYTKHHIGALIQNMLLKITDMNLSSCWVGAFSDITLRNLLNIPESNDIEAVLPVGYKSKIDKTQQKNKPGLEARIFYESYGNRFKRTIRKISGH